MATSPNIKNYTIPTGFATFTPTAGSPRDLGNVVNFSVTNDVTRKDHFRNRGGRRTKDKTVVTQVASTVKFTLDEITAENLAIFALGDVSTDTDGNINIAGLSETLFVGTIKVTGDNEEGTQVDWTGDVSFVPSGDFILINDNDDFSTIAVEADVQEDDNGNFGIWTIREQS